MIMSRASQIETCTKPSKKILFELLARVWQDFTLQVSEICFKIRTSMRKVLLEKIQKP